MTKYLLKSLSCEIISSSVSPSSPLIYVLPSLWPGHSWSALITVQCCHSKTLFLIFLLLTSSQLCHLWLALLTLFPAKNIMELCQYYVCQMSLQFTIILLAINQCNVLPAVTVSSFSLFTYPYFIYFLHLPYYYLFSRSREIEDHWMWTLTFLLSTLELFIYFSHCYMWRKIFFFVLYLCSCFIIYLLIFIWLLPPFIILLLYPKETCLWVS